MKTKIYESLTQIDKQFVAESRVAKLVTLFKLVGFCPDAFRTRVFEDVDDLIERILEGVLINHPACVNELRESEKNS